MPKSPCNPNCVHLGGPRRGEMTAEHSTSDILSLHGRSMTGRLLQVDFAAPPGLASKMVGVPSR